MMNKKVAFAITTVLILSVFIMNGCFGKSAGRIKIKGSTTILPIMQKASESFNKLMPARTKISIEASCSAEGINELLNGSCDIAASSRRMNADELKMAREKQLTIKEVLIAKDMISAIVNSENPVDSVTINQLKRLYTGEITNWKDLQGEDAAVMLVSRDDCSGTLDIWKARVLKKQIIGESALQEASSEEVYRTVSENRDAIGFVGYGYIRKHVKALTINGIPPKPENARLGRYPLSRELYIYFDENNTSEKVMDFIAFLASPEGEACVANAGYMPNR